MQYGIFISIWGDEMWGEFFFFSVKGKDYFWDLNLNYYVIYLNFL